MKCLQSDGMAWRRRQFLRFLLSSPLLKAQQTTESVIAHPEEALNVLDFEPAAKKILPPAHYGYLATGVEDDLTLRANREGFRRYFLRPRRLIDIRSVDTRINLLGSAWESPIAFAPVGNSMAFHPEGELPVARAARAKNVVQILSTNTDTSLADIVKARGGPVWYQLYAPSSWPLLERLVHRAEEAGCPTIALTVDTQAGRRTETFERFRRLDKRDCTVCHGMDRRSAFARKPMFQGMDLTGVLTQDPGMTWTHVQRLRKLTSVKLLIKGIESADDAKLCVEAGADGVIVSNHGGRAGETGRGTIEALPEVLDAVSKRIPVLIDGGFRRGSDVLKALALGAKAVCIGRPYIWGLAAFGQPGVERVIELMRAELALSMKQCGVTSVSGITPGLIGSHG